MSQIPSGSAPEVGGSPRRQLRVRRRVRYRLQSCKYTRCPASSTAAWLLLLAVDNSTLAWLVNHTSRVRRCHICACRWSHVARWLHLLHLCPSKPKCVLKGRGER